MIYEEFSIEDFASDEYFQIWVWNKNIMADTFWTDWIKQHPEKKETIEKARQLVLLMDFDHEDFTEKDLDGIWRNIVSTRGKGKMKRLGVRKIGSSDYRPFLKIAGVFLAAIAVTTFLNTTRFFDNEEHPVIDTESSVVLELQDGTRQILDENTSKDITDKGGNTILTQEKNVLHYGEEGYLTAKELVYNQLTVPYGKKFELKLSDGSYVYLNSGSKLRYPVHFSSKTSRDVYLDGEAYFSVKQDKTRPFTVITDEMNTRVYGTKFNVSSYKNENNTATVLVEGSVGVYKSNNEDAESPIVMVPGTRAVFQNEEIKVAKANISKYTAWTKNKLLFLDDPFHIIIRKLERHFAVEINNEFTELESKNFTGTFEKESLADILNIFREYTPFEYRIENDVIVISKYKTIPIARQ
ncbi:FecR family protein [Maribacter sp. 2307ULW6-5]|uniref:FecR family protein n=1 Tax=Maribacter sp. 2307ULW6-5 TaxID=3386275 RepID=UPI0039BD310E